MIRFLGCLITFCLVTKGVTDEVVAEDPVPLLRAHAHNDYLHTRPLQDALDQGFCSVEADIFLVKGELLVAHTPFDLDPERSLKSLYLEPLRKRVKVRDGSVYSKKVPFTLLVDIKNAGEESWRVLNSTLAKYPSVFSRFEDGVIHPKAVHVIVSGNRAIRSIAASNPRFTAIDGRLPDLKGNFSSDLIPLVSDNWRNHFKWNGRGAIPAEEFELLKSLVSQTHAQSKRIRFWAVPDRPEAWKALRDAGVDLINTDDLSGLGDFLRTERASDANKQKVDTAGGM